MNNGGTEKLNDYKFRDQVFFVNEDTLKPTPETSFLIDLALQKALGIGHVGIVVDVGTGCGNIGISIALEGNVYKVFCLDISNGAVEVARKNVDRYGLSDFVAVLQGDLLRPLKDMKLEGKVSIIVSNPPYIPTSSLARMDSEDRKNQPMIALDGGIFGIDIIIRLVEEGFPFLSEGGWLIFEFGAGQEKLVSKVLRNHGGYTNIEIHRVDRKCAFICAMKP